MKILMCEVCYEDKTGKQILLLDNKFWDKCPICGCNTWVGYWDNE